MNPHRAEAGCLEKIAVLGAESPSGARVRSALEAAGVPGGRIDLYGATEGEVVLTEYEGEARLIQDPALDDIRGHGVIFVCEPGEVASRVVSGGAADPMVIDFTGSASGRANGRLVKLDPPPPDPRSGRGVFVIPHHLSLAAARVLRPIAAGPGVHTVTMVALRPAGDFGAVGVEELRGQTVNLLNFTSVPTEVFGRQLAFNYIPQDLAPSEDPGIEDVVGGEITELLGLPDRSVSVRMVVVPVFYGHGILIHVETVRESSVDVLTVRLEGAPELEISTDLDRCTPLGATGLKRTVIAPPTPDGRGGFWIWGVADEAGAAAAELGVGMARFAGHI